MIIIAYILQVYLVQMMVSAFVNVINDTRMPLNIFDFIKKTFLPWLLFNLKKVKNK